MIASDPVKPSMIVSVVPPLLCSSVKHPHGYSAVVHQLTGIFQVDRSVHMP